MASVLQSMRRFVKSWLPDSVGNLLTPVRRWPGHVRNVLEAPRRRYLWPKSLARFAALPDYADAPDDLLDDLQFAWNNPYAASKEYMLALTRHAWQTSGPILECGSGLSTILLGVIAQRKGIRVWSLEHQAHWADRIRRTLRKAGLDSVTVVHAALRDYGDFVWYDLPLADAPRDFRLVICDGPPGQVKGGRFGLMPVAREHLSPGCTILLDDAHRPSEQEVLRKWSSQLGITWKVFGKEKGIASGSLPQSLIE